MNLKASFVEIKLIKKIILNINSIIICTSFILTLTLSNKLLANNNFIVAIVNKIPISKIDVINKAKVLSFSLNGDLNEESLSRFYNQALKNIINQKIILSEGLKNNKNIENLVSKEALILLLQEFKNSEDQLKKFLKKLSIPKSTLLEKYNSQLILGYILKKRYKTQLINLEKTIDYKINEEKKKKQLDLYELAEIVINKDNGSKLFKDIQLAIKKGANFLEIARQVSISSSSKFNGKLGWKTLDELSKIMKINQDPPSEGDIFSLSKGKRIYIYKILAKREKGKLSSRENILLVVQAKFPVGFKKRNLAYDDVKNELDKLLNNKNNCENLKSLGKSNKLNISLSMINSRVADMSSNILNMLQNNKLFEISKPIFSGNYGYSYVMCDMQLAKKDKFNPDILKRKIMNKYLLTLSDKLLKRLEREAKIKMIEKIK